VDSLHDQLARLDACAPQIVEGGSDFGHSHGQISSITATP
jgi:hypothetical protein